MKKPILVDLILFTLFLKQLRLGASTVSWSKLFYLSVIIIVRRSSLKTGPAWPEHIKIAIDITAVDIDLFFSLQYRYNDHV